MQFWEVWLRRFINSPVHYGLFLFAIGASVAALKRNLWHLPFLVYVLWVLLATFQITASDERYISSIVPTLAILSGIAIWLHLRHRTRFIQVTALLLLGSALVTQAYSDIINIRYEHRQPTMLDEVVRFFHNRTDASEKILVERSFVPTLQHYFPQKTVHSYSTETDSVESLSRRLQAARYDGIVYRGKQHDAFHARLGQSFTVLSHGITSSGRENVVFYQLSSKTTPEIPLAGSDWDSVRRANLKHPR
jgi:hypothetical protein